MELDMGKLGSGEEGSYYNLKGWEDVGAGKGEEYEQGQVMERGLYYNLLELEPVEDCGRGRGSAI